MTYTVLNLINWAFEIFSFLILIEVIGSWIVMMRVRLPNVVYDILRVVHSITSPVLEPIRRLIPSLGGLDLSPIIALLLLDVLRRLVIGALMSLS